jgi:hypothetical protein
MKEEHGFLNRHGYGDQFQGHPDKLIGTKITAANHLIGKILKTKSDDSVKIIAYCPELEQPIIGILNNELEQWHKNGHYCQNQRESFLLDLVLEDNLSKYNPYDEIEEALLKHISLTGKKEAIMYIYKDKWEELLLIQENFNDSKKNGFKVIDYHWDHGIAHLRPSSFNNKKYYFA